ncbi:gluconate transporter [Skermanella aerolata]|uniref:Gluconate transporter n=1 Tax=Skermanella aerolata TaxID=393310 RepID=A0A512DJA4_9PROT|nr:gluconate:H+ symporter [Skermanella aerolata]KJB97296.1 gluconate transporter [Skermanella aerolata KACC 11604]GEO36549.1 gluconate transporter [Skermanella aerolata]
MSGAYLILVAAAGISALLFLVIKVRLHAFVTLLLVSLLVGVAAGMPLEGVIKSVEKGMGGTLGFVAVVVGLGAMFGQLLEVSGGAERLARTMVRKFGDDKVQWALGLTGFIVSIPVFLDVAIVILVPILYRLARDSGKPLLYYGIPLVAGGAVTHAFIPPTPGPIAVADLLGADLGWVILYGVICGLPAMVLAGPVWGSYISRRITKGVPDYVELGDIDESRELPSFGEVLAIIMTPLLLILVSTTSGIMLDEGNPLRSFLVFIGHPYAALLIATLLAMFLLGSRRGYDREEIQNIVNKALEPAGIIILVTGAGGVFKQVLIDSGVGQVLGDMMSASGLPYLVLAFVISALIRVAQGSATVAMVTAAGLIGPILEQNNVEGSQLALATIAIAAGGTILSHVNDSGFWLVNRFFGLTEKETLQSWTVATTIVSLVGFVMVLLLGAMVG